MLGAGGVADEVQSLHAALGELCAALDPASVPLPEVAGLWSGFDAIERLASGAKCRLADRVEQSRAWQREGDRSAADWMARQSGITTGRARSVLEASRRLASLPGTDEALAKGELLFPQAEAITDAATADPSSEPRLLGTAKRRGLRELREDCARTKARAEDAAERAARLHRQRCLRTWKASDGSWNLSLRNTPEAGADIEAALAPLRDQIFNTARLAGRSEPTEAYAADALSELVRLGATTQQSEGSGGGTGRSTDPVRGESPDGEAPGRGDGDGSVSGRGEVPGGSTGTGAVPGDAAGGCGSAGDGGEGASGVEPASDGEGTESRWTRRSRRPDTKVIVLIDYEALRRGHAETGETCEIAGVGPISVQSAVRSWPTPLGRPS